VTRRLWSVSARELQGQLVVLAITTWLVAAANVLTPGMHYRTGQVKGADFLHFYVLGHVAADDRFDLLYDTGGLHAEQARLVPVSRGRWFVPIYGPQTALLFAPLAGLPYLAAAICWALVTVLLYGACVWMLWRGSASLAGLGRIVALAAAAYPPLCSLVLHGQTSVLPLLCLTLGYVALKEDRRWWAGVALGSLIIKPQLGLALAVVLVSRREWRVIGGVMTAIALQWGASALVFGAEPMLAYFDMLRRGPALAALLEPKPSQLHSLRAFWNLLVAWPSVALTLYLLSSVAVLVAAVRLWRQDVPLGCRYSALAIATVLVAPHLGVYELVLLVPAFILTANQSEQARGRVRPMFRCLLYIAFLTPLAGPLSAVTRVQLSVPVAVVWLAALYWSAVHRTGVFTNGLTDVRPAALPTATGIPARGNLPDCQGGQPDAACAAVPPIRRA